MGELIRVYGVQVRCFEKQGRYWVDFKDATGKRHRASTGTTDWVQAQAAAAMLVRRFPIRQLPVGHQVLGGLALEYVEPGEMTLRQAFERGKRVRETWLLSKNPEGIRDVFEQVARYFGENRALMSISRDEVLDWRFAMSCERGQRNHSRLSASTINHRLSMLSVLMDIADVQRHRVRHLSVKGNHRTRRISDAEVARIDEWLESRDHLKGADTLKDLMALALSTAARQGELLGLAWGDVAESHVTFRDTKNRETRSVPLTRPSRQIIERRRAIPIGPFSDVDVERVQALWKDYRSFIGLDHDPEFVFHTLRHEAISRLADKGVPAFTLQAIAGHSNVTTTQRYVKMSLHAMALAMGAL